MGQIYVSHSREQDAPATSNPAASRDPRGALPALLTDRPMLAGLPPFARATLLGVPRPHAVRPRNFPPLALARASRARRGAVSCAAGPRGARSRLFRRRQPSPAAHHAAARRFRAGVDGRRHARRAEPKRVRRHLAATPRRVCRVDRRTPSRRGGEDHRRLRLSRSLDRRRAGQAARRARGRRAVGRPRPHSPADARILG